MAFSTIGKTTAISTFFLTLLLLLSVCTGAESGTDEGGKTITVIDDAGRTVTVPADSHNIATVGGCGPARFLVYLGESDRITALDEVETRASRLTFEPRPYALAHREFLNLTVVGDTSGKVNMEALAAANPDMLILHYSAPDIAQEADRITESTGIPVVLVSNQGDFGENREQLEQTMGILAKITNSEQRNKEFFDYFDQGFADLKKRTEDIPDSEKVRVYIAGVAYNGARAIDSTDPGYAPFIHVNADNVASSYSRAPDALNAIISKEKILEMDPDYLFIDTYSQRAPDRGTFGNLANETAFQGMTAVKNDNVYGLLPYVWVGVNHEQTLANAYYIGSIIYPDRFSDIDPKDKADEIYTFVVGKPVFGKINEFLGDLAFEKIHE